jgi:anti-anti-sigma factor
MAARHRARGVVRALQVEGPLRAPIGGELRGRVRTLLERGALGIVVDLSRVTSIDAAGVGELASAIATSVASNAELSVVHPTTRVRHMLERAGLLELMTRSASEPVAVTRDRRGPR